MYPGRWAERGRQYSVSSSWPLAMGPTEQGRLLLEKEGPLLKHRLAQTPSQPGPALVRPWKGRSPG